MSEAVFQSIEISGRVVGPGQKAFVIAEVAQAHDGSLGMAHAFVDAAARAGADAVKFQTHIADAESTLDEPFRVAFSRQDATRFEYWRRMEFTPEQWSGLVEHAQEKRLIFLSSAFSVQAVRLLTKLAMPAWKIASGELSSTALVDEMAKSGAPFLISTGMSNWDEIGSLVHLVRSKGRQLALFQCTSRYPTSLEQVGLNVIGELRRRFDCPAGLSDHSGKIFPSLAAIARGANLIEAHITLDRGMFGPDVPASLTVEEFGVVVAARDAFATMDANPVDKDGMAAEMAEMRRLFNRSIAPSRDLQAGTILAADMLAAKKPGSGIPFGKANEMIGRRLKCDVFANRLLAWSDLE